MLKCSPAGLRLSPRLVPSGWLVMKVIATRISGKLGSGNIGAANVFPRGRTGAFTLTLMPTG